MDISKQYWLGWEYWTKVREPRDTWDERCVFEMASATGYWQ